MTPLDARIAAKDRQAEAIEFVLHLTATAPALKAREAYQAVLGGPVRAALLQCKAELSAGGPKMPLAAQAAAADRLAFKLAEVWGRAADELRELARWSVAEVAS